MTHIPIVGELETLPTRFPSLYEYPHVQRKVELTWGTYAFFETIADLLLSVREREGFEFEVIRDLNILHQTFLHQPNLVIKPELSEKEKGKIRRHIKGVMEDPWAQYDGL